MSVVISYVSDNVSIIMTDTRVSYGKSMGNTVSFTDDNEKLYSLNRIGWAAGAGILYYLDKLKEGLDANPINNDDDILNIFNSIYKEISSDADLIPEEIKKTALVVSWMSKVDNNLVPRLAVLNKKDNKDYPIKKVEKNQIHILFPFEYTKNETLIENFLCRYEIRHDFVNLETSLQLMLDIFKEIEGNSNYVSRICDVGIYTFNASDVGKVRIRENIDTLDAHLRQNNILPLIQTIEIQ